MADSIPNLWPKEFKVDVQTPLAILRVQANNLSRVTKGILQGTVETESSKDVVQHRLVIVAPAYRGYRHTLITAVHHPDLTYPVEVRASSLAEKLDQKGNIARSVFDTFMTRYPSANNDEQMLNLVSSALNSEETGAAILSLIAKSNEVLATTTLPTPSEGAEPS